MIQSEQGADFIINQENDLQEHKEAAALLKQPEQEYRLHRRDTWEHGHAPTAQMSSDCLLGPSKRHHSY